MTEPVVTPTPPPRAAVIVPAADPLFTETLRAALQCYISGDYRRAADYFQDAAAVAGYRPDAHAFATLGLQLENAVASGQLISRDAATRRSPAEPQ